MWCVSSSALYMYMLYARRKLIKMKSSPEGGCYCLQVCNIAMAMVMFDCLYKVS